jgi:membrane-bound lytic murein transglycosylase
MDLAAAVAALVAGDRAQVLELLKPTPLWQPIYQEGFNKAHGEGRTKLEAETTKRTELEGQLATATTQLEQLKRDKPDLAAIQTQHQQALTALETTHRTAMQAKDAEITEERTAGVLARFEQRLTSGKRADGTDRKKLHPSYAAVLRERQQNRERIKVGADKSITVLQKDRATPFGAATTDAALDLLADELIAEAPPEFVLAGTDAGGGVQGGGGTGEQGKNHFDKIREDVKAKAEAQVDVKPHGPFARLAQ